MNIPNQLTIGRLVLTAVFVGVLSSKMPLASTIGLILFIVAALTDMLDGIIARRWNLITNFGKLMDPLADKVLMCSTFVLFVELDQLAAWVVVVILTREFLVTGLRLIATSKGAILAADSLGKWKTILQMVLAIYVLLGLAAKENALFSPFLPLYEWHWFGPAILGRVLIYATLAITVISGLSYLFKNAGLLRETDDEGKGNGETAS